MTNEIEIVTDKIVRERGMSPRVISSHGKLEIAMKKAKKNVTGTYIIHQPETYISGERFLVCLPDVR